MRKLAYLFLFIFLAMGSLAAYSVYASLNTARSITQPVSDLVRQLAMEATPVIMPDPVTIVHEINDLARLETASYSMQKVIRAERNNEIMWGAFGETMLFVAVGEVIAGVDLQKMQPEDLQVVDPQTVMVYLPPAEIFVATLDNERSQVVDRRTGLFVRADPQLETMLRQTAEREILEDALGSGILDRANENAQSFMRSFLNGLGFENVTFTSSTPPPAPVYQQEIPKGYVVTPVAP